MEPPHSAWVSEIDIDVRVLRSSSNDDTFFNLDPLQSIKRGRGRIYLMIPRRTADKVVRWSGLAPPWRPGERVSGGPTSLRSLLEARRMNSDW